MALIKTKQIKKTRLGGDVALAKETGLLNILLQ